MARKRVAAGFVIALVLASPTTRAGEEPTAIFEFDVPESIEYPPGESSEITAWAIIEGHGPEGIRSWSFSLSAEGAAITDITIDGLAIGDQPLDQSQFRLHELAADPDDPERHGAVGALVGVGYPMLHADLPGDVRNRVARLTLEREAPAAGECEGVRLFYEDGFKGSGQPVSNVVWHALAGNLGPELVDREFAVCGFDDEPFRRGDANGDDTFDLSDAIFVLDSLYRGTEFPDCLDASDLNDDGELNIVDPIHILNYLFHEFAPPPPPLECGNDPTADELTCWAYRPCE